MAEIDLAVQKNSSLNSGTFGIDLFAKIQFYFLILVSDFGSNYVVRAKMKSYNVSRFLRPSCIAVTFFKVKISIVMTSW